MSPEVFDMLQAFERHVREHRWVWFTKADVLELFVQITAKKET